MKKAAMNADARFVPGTGESVKSGLKGDIAVLYDKNHMENSGYAAVLADLVNEPVWLVPFHKSDVGRTAEFDDQDVLHVIHEGERSRFGRHSGM